MKTIHPNLSMSFNESVNEDKIASNNNRRTFYYFLYISKCVCLLIPVAENDIKDT